MPNPLLVINFKMVKDKHNVILILVSSKILIPYSWGSSNSCFHLFHLLFFPEFQALIISEIHLNHCKDSPCVFNFSFFSFLLFTGVLHGGSTWWFIKDLYFFLKCSSRFFSKKLKLSSYGNPECNFFLPYYRRWYYVILDNLSSCFSWFTWCQEWDILNPSISSLKYLGLYLT